jgi:acetolactate synthase-1/2/3 large subunit
LWSGAADALNAFVDATGIPFYSTPQGRGAIADDHPYHYEEARSTAFREADVVLVVGTRLNWIFGSGLPPRFSPTATFIQIDIDPTTLDAASRVDTAIVADVQVALQQLVGAVSGSDMVARFEPWRSALEAKAVASRTKRATTADPDQVPIHPTRLCTELRDLLPRDAMLVVDGQEILNYARQSIPTYLPGHLMNSGPFGIMGVGVPFGVGVKAAKPDQLVVVLSGDGAFGMNGMELYTAVRHDLPILVVLSVNGGWSADPDRSKPGRDLGYPRYDRIAEMLGCHGEFVDQPDGIRPALERAISAVSAGRSALVDVVTDWAATADTVKFTKYMT